MSLEVGCNCGDENEGEDGEIGSSRFVTEIGDGPSGCGKGRKL